MTDRKISRTSFGLPEGIAATRKAGVVSASISHKAGTKTRAEMVAELRSQLVSQAEDLLGFATDDSDTEAALVNIDVAFASRTSDDESIIEGAATGTVILVRPSEALEVEEGAGAIAALPSPADTTSEGHGLYL